MTSDGLSRRSRSVIRPPLPVIIISLALIVSGAAGLVFHLNDFNVWISLVRLIAVVCGVFMLRADNWARWLSLAWIAFHVILSIFHSPLQLGVHILVFAAFAYFLFRPRTNEYFRGTMPDSRESTA
jgi:hypothetical protein